MCGFVCWKQFPVGKVRRFIFRFIKTTVLARDNAGAGRVSRSFISVWIRHSRFRCIIPTQNCVKVFVVFFFLFLPQWPSGLYLGNYCLRRVPFLVSSHTCVALMSALSTVGSSTVSKCQESALSMSVQIYRQTSRFRLSSESNRLASASVNSLLEVGTDLDTTKLLRLRLS